MDKFIKIIIIMVLSAVIVFGLSTFNTTIVDRGAKLDEGVRLLYVKVSSQKNEFDNLRKTYEDFRNSLKEERIETEKQRKDNERIIKEIADLRKK